MPMGWGNTVTDAAAVVLDKDSYGQKAEPCQYFITL